MEKDDLIILRAVIDTLNGISVQGYGNMSRLVGCINALQDLIRKNTKEVSDGR